MPDIGGLAEYPPHKAPIHELFRTNFECGAKGCQSLAAFTLEGHCPSAMICRSMKTHACTEEKPMTKRA
jgi:hypothetical protein